MWRWAPVSATSIATRTATDVNNNDATANAGIGFKYFITEDVALRADTRAIMSFHATPALEISKNDYWINYEYTLGVQFLFGGKKPVVAKLLNRLLRHLLHPKRSSLLRRLLHRLTARSAHGPTGALAPLPAAAAPRPVPGLSYPAG